MPQNENSCDGSKMSTPSKKQERSKSDEVKRTCYDESSETKKELENGFIVKKSEKEHRRSSGDHSSTKKERKDSQDSHSSHRKEVKNLDGDFSSKKEKSKHRTPSKHEKSERKSDDAKHNGSSKSKNRDESRPKSHSKHEKEGSSHKHRDNDKKSDKSDTSSKKDDVNSLKRKNNEVQYYSPHKKLKEENSIESITENGTSPKCTEDVNNKDLNNSSEIENSVKKDINSCFDECEERNSKVVNINSNSNSENSEKSSNSWDVDRKNDNYPVNFVNIQRDLDQVIGFDLRQQMYNCGSYMSNATLPPPPPPPPPPLPPSSPPDHPPPPPPPENPPPPPPDSPMAVSPNESLPFEKVQCEEGNRLVYTPSSNEIPVPDSPNMEETVPLVNNRLQDNCIMSKDKSNNPQQIKKIKKKIVKKPVKEESESYDLLGDIISQMEKKK